MYTPIAFARKIETSPYSIRLFGMILSAHKVKYLMVGHYLFIIERRYILWQTENGENVYPIITFAGTEEISQYSPRLLLSEVYTK